MSDHPVITRRDFVRSSVGAVVAGSAACSHDSDADAFQPAPPSGPRPARTARVVIVRDPAALSDAHDVNVSVLDQMLADTVVRVTGQKTPRAAWQSLFKPGDTIGLVPTPHLNPTHGELVEAVRRALVDAGVPAANVREAQGRIDLPRACTALIAMPGLKAHWLTGIGTVLKNYIVYSGNPRNYHDANSVNLGEIWLLPDVKGKTRLILVDALRPLCDKGPQPDPRFMWDYKGLIAGTDPVAVETVGLQIIMAKRKALRGEDWPLSPPPLSIAAADEKFGLGTSRMSEIRVERSGWADEALI
jgi:hypothetical protein